VSPPVRSACERRRCDRQLLTELLLTLFIKLQKLSHKTDLKEVTQFFPVMKHVA